MDLSPAPAAAAAAAVAATTTTTTTTTTTDPVHCSDSHVSPAQPTQQQPTQQQQLAEPQQLRLCIRHRSGTLVDAMAVCEPLTESTSLWRIRDSSMIEAAIQRHTRAFSVALSLSPYGVVQEIHRPPALRQPCLPNDLHSHCGQISAASTLPLTSDPDAHQSLCERLFATNVVLHRPIMSFVHNDDLPRLFRALNQLPAPSLELSLSSCHLLSSSPSPSSCLSLDMHSSLPSASFKSFGLPSLSRFSMRWRVDPLLQPHTPQDSPPAISSSAQPQSQPSNIPLFNAAPAWTNSDHTSLEAARSDTQGNGDSSHAVPVTMPHDPDFLSDAALLPVRSPLLLNDSYFDPRSSPSPSPSPSPVSRSPSSPRSPFQPLDRDDEKYFWLEVEAKPCGDTILCFLHLVDNISSKTSPCTPSVMDGLDMRTWSAVDHHSSASAMQALPLLTKGVFDLIASMLNLAASTVLAIGIPKTAGVEDVPELIQRGSFQLQNYGRFVRRQMAATLGEKTMAKLEDAVVSVEASAPVAFVKDSAGAIGARLLLICRSLLGDKLCDFCLCLIPQRPALQL
ncbi:hypothetical protein BC831DRAFT_470578 [Entophlyctis helioformis]|nr:hypothetical protein BC831DRAFT_470578 [Entophlyctis helioformis]